MNIDPVIDQMQHQDRLDADDKKIQEDLAYHRQNWLDAVLKSPSKSLMDTPYKVVPNNEGKYVKVLSNSEDVLLDEILNGTEERLATILIQMYKKGGNEALRCYINTLADSYAERMVGV